MKILHITNAYPTEKYSSFGIFIKEQIDSLNSLGFQNDHYFINAWEKGKKEYFTHIKEIRKLSKDYDLIHCHHIYTILPYLLSCSGKPFIVSLLGDINSGRKIADKILLYTALLTAKKIIYKNEITSPYKKMIYLPNGVNTEFFVPSDKKDAKKAIGADIDKKYALFVSAAGTNNSIKRYDKFEAVLKLLKEKGIELYPLVAAGVKRESVPIYFNASDVMILTSDHEGSPNAVKEAMSCNIPVVSTNVGNVKQMLSGCNSSFVAESNTAEELSGLVIRALNSENNNGRSEIFIKKLDMMSIAGKLKELYEEILGIK